VSARLRGRPKQQRGYLRQASKTFLEGTHCRTPEDAVLRGIRSLEEWVDALNQAREAQQLNVTFSRASSLRRAETP
jgi:hypothetical protein